MRRSSPWRVRNDRQRDLINWGVKDGYTTIETARPGFVERIFGKVTDLPTQLKAISAIYQVTPDDPLLLLIHGDKDKTVPVQQSAIMKAKYEETGLKGKLIVQPDRMQSF